MYFQETKEQASKIKSFQKVKVLEFVDDMPDLMRACLGVVTRAGATILTEISLAKKAAIIVPNPLLPRAHQVHNARIYQRADAAWLVSDSGQKVNQRALKQALNELINSSVKRLKYEHNVSKLAVLDATQRTLAVIEEVVAAITDFNNTDDKKLLSGKSAKQKTLNQITDDRYKSKDKILIRKYKKSLRFLILFSVVISFLFKVFYIGDIKLQAIEDSPLMTQNELEDLQVKIDSFFKPAEFFPETFSLNFFLFRG